jgi:predicted phage-related endonuclease
MSTTERLEWLQARQSGIGSSDAPNLIGLGWSDAASVYRSKVEPVVDRRPAGNLRRGLELEPIVAAMYTEIMRVELATKAAENIIVRHRDRDWQFCTPDRWRSDGGLVQFKTTAGFSDEWGPSGTDEIPETYRIERCHEMGVCGVDWMDVIALDVIGWEPRVYRLLFDRTLFDWLTEVEAEFWQRIQERKPVDAEWSEQFKPHAIKLIDPTPAPDLGAEIAAIIERRERVRKVRKEAEAIEEGFTDRIREALGNNARATAGDWKVKQVRIPGATFTMERSAYNRLTITKAKGK